MLQRGEPVNAAASVQRLKQKAEFERALSAGSPAVVARGVHFVVHFVPEGGKASGPGQPDKLSTGPVLREPTAVDVSLAADLAWVGTVLPKRWARRSVTRTLLKRQVFAAFERHLPSMPPGVWVVRLRAAFDRKQFPSAASQALKDAARTELDSLMRQAGPRAARQRSPRAAAAPA